jgi:hypothetical protein
VDVSQRELGGEKCTSWFEQKLGANSVVGGSCLSAAGMENKVAQWCLQAGKQGQQGTYRLF